MSVVVPPDATPSVTGFPSVSTRIIYAQWVYTDGTGVTTPPTIDYLGGPYFASVPQATMFARTQVAQLATSVGDDTVGVWWAEVIVHDDPDLIGNVAVRITHSVLPGGSITIAVPSGAGPLNIASAQSIVGVPGSQIVITGPKGDTGAQGPRGPQGAPGPGLVLGAGLALDTDGHYYAVPGLT